MDLVTTKQYFFILSEISSATCHTKLKSASSSNLLEGVPTVIKKISVFSELFFMLEAKDNNFVLLICLSKSLSIPGSKNGHVPDLSFSRRSVSLSIHVTEYPNSAKQTPVTKPT